MTFKSMYEVKQKGNNPEFPDKAIVWKYGDKEIPEWLTDRANIKELNENGNPILDIRTRVSGEIEILESGGRDILVKLKNENSFLLYSKTHPILSVTEHQLKLLYI